MMIYCCQCKIEVEAVLVSGKETYPHRDDLFDLPFWRCPTCRNFVGCHHKTENRTRPLGNIPNAELKSARQHIHKILDPIWKSGKISRGEVYKKISDKIGYQYHTAEIKTVEEAREIYKIVKDLSHENSK
ncbi:MAG: zinc-finger-containing protein [Pseudomonadota bacterium]